MRNITSIFSRNYAAEFVPALRETWSLVQGVGESEDPAEKGFVGVQRNE